MFDQSVENDVEDVEDVDGVLFFSFLLQRHEGVVVENYCNYYDSND